MLSNVNRCRPDYDDYSDVTPVMDVQRMSLELKSLNKKLIHPHFHPEGVNLVLSEPERKFCTEHNQQI